MYKEWIRLPGHHEDVDSINAAYKAATGNPEPLFDDGDEWRAWVEYDGDKTVILYDGV